MIDLYTWGTPNGRKVSIALEEFGLPYQTHAIDIGADELLRLSLTGAIITLAMMSAIGLGVLLQLNLTSIVLGLCSLPTA